MKSQKKAYITLRNVPLRLARALGEESERRGKSINQTAIEALASGIGLNESDSIQTSNGLEILAGTWTAQQFEDFEKGLNELRSDRDHSPSAPRIRHTNPNK